ncbi:MAG TPA: UDP-N-acetylmuramoyl-L-alanyl-D-glutamate--2,6-diaminopimelate ligase, partial [Gammaproteobacteria bacterium]|nr:UDP-N-acetylmuramoyl-L-alanyl-D-glutamate--2,6-diaminopimelate ligase [Gammaproteobacteria bacterium]
MLIMNDIHIKNLTTDSRQVKPGDLFIAVPGLTVDGRAYIEQAIKNGAVAVVTERKLIGHIAARFFSNPSKQLPVIGITGTSGKTSVSHFIAEIMSYCERSCGVIGTLGTGIFSEKQRFKEIRISHDEKPDKTTHDYTTPDAIAVQRTLAALQKQNVSVVAMEVTSHALDQNRVAGVEFDTVIFTNLTRDHLDYHQNMQTYGEVKKKLFTEFQAKQSIINLDDAFGRVLFTELKALNKTGRVLGYSCHKIPPVPPFSKGGNNVVIADNVVLDKHGIRATVKTPWGEGELRSHLLGLFNVSNILAALTAVCLQGVPLNAVLKAIKAISTAPGRMMRFGGNTEMPLVIVDYAHKPDALALVLEALRGHCVGELWCVVGCGGDRDRGKRPVMAAIGERLSDHLYLTQDNPRTEDPTQIMAEMIQGLKNPTKVIVEYDRAKAIDSAIKNAKAEDIILVAGKGHETYQIIGTEKMPFSDKLVVEAALERRMLCLL